MNQNLIQELLKTQNEALIFEAVQQMPAVFEIKDEAMNNLFINNFGCELMGYQKEDVVGKNSLEFIPATYHKEFIESTKKLFADKKTKRITRLYDAEGQVHTIVSNIKVCTVNGKDYSFHVWFEITDFPEIFELAKYKTPLQENKKPISDKLLGIYRDMLFTFLIKDENFKNQELSLLSMSVQLKIPQKYISHIINTELGIGFSDYINYLRLNYFNEIKHHPDNTIFTKEAIAGKSGFSSNATFYRAQKKFKNQDVSFSLK